MDPVRTLYLIDGYAQFFRAYHAIRTPMSSPVTKEPTNMTFGFIGMLLKLLRGEGKVGTVDGRSGARPDFVAVTLDVSGDRGTFRSQLYPEYKATRKAPPEDLFPQVERCLGVLRSIGVPVIGAEGYEADDVIATLVTRLRAASPGLRIRIISKDKDLKQLLTPAGVEPAVELYDLHTDEIINAAALHADLGLEPSQVIDFLTLMGDTSDNVPGVEGVGPKTAAHLISTYRTLDELMSRSDEIKGKRGEAIRAAAGVLPLSKQLVTLRHDVPAELDLEAARPERWSLARLVPMLKELGFNRYQDDVRALLGETAGSAGGATVTSSAGRTADKLGGAGDGVKTGPRVSLFGEGAGGFGLFDHLETSRPQDQVLMPAAGEYRCIKTKAQLDEAIEELRSAECIAVDTETTGLSPMRAKLVGVCLSGRIGTGMYIPVRSPVPDEHLDEPTVIAALKPLLEAPGAVVCGHNLKFDMLVLRRAELELGGLMRPRASIDRDYAISRCLPATAFDSMIASYLIDATRSSHGLDALALALLGRTNISIKDLIGTGANQRTFDRVPLESATQYAAEDADVALQLRAIMLPQLKAKGLWSLFTEVEMPLVSVLATLEFNGVRVDKPELERQRARLQTRIDVLARELDAASEDAIGRRFNPESPKQLAAVLFNAADHVESPGLGLTPIKKTKTGFSTDAEVLDKLAEDPTISTPIPRLIVEHRELTKLVGTYLVSLANEIHPETGRIHASFNQTVAATGRLSSSDPNLQNIPIRTDIGREIRRAFVAAPGCVLVSADYSQIELKLLAHLSRDPALIQAFQEGADIHAAVAAQINNVPIEQVSKTQRSGAKMVNFGIVYGITAFGLARRLGCSNTEADQIITGYKKRFAGITTFLEECVAQARRFGYVETMLKRQRPIPEIDARDPSRRAFAERTAINSVVQGSAADLIKLAMVNIQSLLVSERASGDGARPRMLLQIHDELVFECPTEHGVAFRDSVVREMASAMTLSVPLTADASISDNWFGGR
jgi:DNA polymerase I